MLWTKFLNSFLVLDSGRFVRVAPLFVASLLRERRGNFDLVSFLDPRKLWYLRPIEFLNMEEASLCFKFWLPFFGSFVGLIVASAEKMS